MRPTFFRVVIAHSLDAEAFVKAEHVRVLATGTGHGRVDIALNKQKIHRNIRLTVPHYVALGDVLKCSDLLATVRAHPQTL
jgi:hypothetical protein